MRPGRERHAAVVQEGIKLASELIHRMARGCMGLDKDFPNDPHAVLDPSIRWYPADADIKSQGDRLMPQLVPILRRKVQEFRDSGYVGAAATSASLLRWWFKEPHLIERADGTS